MSNPPRLSQARSYHVVRFDDAGQTDAFVRALQRFLSSPRGEAWGRNTRDTEVWAPRPLSEGPLEVYLSDHALVATEAAFSPVPPISLSRGEELSSDCVLLLKGAELQSEKA
jgi:hypothetical protein